MKKETGDRSGPDDWMKIVISYNFRAHPLSYVPSTKPTRGVGWKSLKSLWGGAISYLTSHHSGVVPGSGQNKQGGGGGFGGALLDRWAASSAAPTDCPASWVCHIIKTCDADYSKRIGVSHDIARQIGCAVLPFLR